MSPVGFVSTPSELPIDRLTISTVVLSRRGDEGRRDPPGEADDDDDELAEPDPSRKSRRRIRCASRRLLLIEPSALGRAYIAHCKQELARARKRWRKGEDGDTDEVMFHDIHRVALQRSVREHWDRPSRTLSDAFTSYMREIFDYYATEELLAASAIAAQLDGDPTAAEPRLARLRALIPESLDPSPTWRADDDPGLHALDVVARVLGADRGLTITPNGGRVVIAAQPQVADPDDF